jgi:hypothetical protein
MSSVFSNTQLSGTAVFVYQQEDDNVQSLINQALTPYITTQQATNIFVNNSKFDASINEIGGEISILDNSINNEKIRNDNQDISINNITLQITDLDNSLNNIQNNLQNNINNLQNNLDNSFNDLQTQIDNINIDFDSSFNDLSNNVNVIENNLQNNINNLSSNKVNRSGDTITGGLIVNNTIQCDDIIKSRFGFEGGTTTDYFHLKQYTQTGNNSPSDNQWFGLKSFQFDDASVLVNREGGQQQLMVLGDTVAGNAGTIFGISQLQNFSPVTYNHIFSILGNGNVGIGRNNKDPQNTLDVSGTALITGNAIVNGIRFTRASNIGYIQVPQTHDALRISPFQSTTSLLEIRNNGNVGINNNNPQQRLDVTGNGVFSGTVTGATPTASTHLTTKAYVDNEITTLNNFNTQNLTRHITHSNRLSTDGGGGVGDFTSHTLLSRKVGTGSYIQKLTITFYSSINTAIKFFVEVYRKGLTPAGSQKIITPLIARDPNTTFNSPVIEEGSIYTFTMPFVISVNPTDITNDNNQIEVKIRPEPSVTSSGHEIRFNLTIVTERVATSDI